jgi:tetratricopeptide (TPR) repeat protein
LTSANNLALSYLAQGKFTQAQPLILSALDIKRRVLGQEHPNTLTGMYTLALLYLYEGRYSVAESLFIELLEKQQRVLGHEHPNTLTTINDLARLYQSTGRYAEAEPLYVKVLELRRRMMRPQDPDTLASLAALGGLRIQQQRYADAEQLLSEAVTGYQETTSDSWSRYNSQSMLGASLAGQKKYAEAELPLLSGYQGMLQREATIPAFDRPEVERAGQWILQLYQEWRKPEQAAEWRDKLQSAKIFGAATKQ